jgi:hypothetical protein
MRDEAEETAENLNNTNQGDYMKYDISRLRRDVMITSVATHVSCSAHGRLYSFLTPPLTFPVILSVWKLDHHFWLSSYCNNILSKFILGRVFPNFVPAVELRPEPLHWHCEVSTGNFISIHCSTYNYMQLLRFIWGLLWKMKCDVMLRSTGYLFWAVYCAVTEYLTIVYFKFSPCSICCMFSSR